MSEHALSPQAIKEFQEHYFKLYGRKISKNEATKKALHLLRLVKLFECNNHFGEVKGKAAGGP